ncbi:MAG: Asp-tRNA(Asn)/Glu-tRNA(Gln) amidotransferase subunit GatC [Candidatus Shapirobacteria bacterium]|nr:Asp-tRNA(Asn)/Glu-tRNA(Gln) amidotransferase subunit GatC [Candidatus Shapirobacteria bacterium]
MSASKISPKSLDHIAKLARIQLNEKEKKTFLPQIESVIEYFDILNQVNTDGVKPTFRVNEQSNVFHEDKIKESLPVKEAIFQATRIKDNYFVVTATIKK